MAAKKGLSKTEKLRKNIKATIRRREAQGWQFDPMDLATVETGGYQALKALQRNNYRKLYEHATVYNPETGQVMTGRQAQLRGRWKGDMWQDIPMPPEVYDSEDLDDSDIYEEDLSWYRIVYDDLEELYGMDSGVNKELLTSAMNMIDALIEDQGDIIYKRMYENGARITRLIQLFCMYYDPQTLEQNRQMGNPMFLQEVRQLLDPEVSLSDLNDYSGDLEDYSDMDWEDYE